MEGSAHQVQFGRVIEYSDEGIVPQPSLHIGEGASFLERGEDNEKW